MRRLTHVIGVSVIDQTRIGALSQNRLDTAAAGGDFKSNCASLDTTRRETFDQWTSISRLEWDHEP